MGSNTIIERLDQKVKEVQKSIQIWADAYEQGEVTVSQYAEMAKRLNTESALLIELLTGEKEGGSYVL